MKTKLIEYKTAEHQEMINLRNKILRAPLGLVFSNEDLEQEKNDILCVCKEGHTIVGCCVLSAIDNKTIKLRQMAVETIFQEKGIGSLLLKFVETTSKEKGYKIITLHARDIAQSFYTKNGFHSCGDTFIEIGIPHIEMKKEI